MGLSNDLLSQFAKVTNNKSQNKKETSTVYGTVVDSGVKLDGSSTVTPSSSTVDMKNGDRVIVMIKNHSAVVTGNLTDSSASSTSVDGKADATDVDKKITALDIAVANRVTTDQLNAEKANITKELTAADATIKNELTASMATIESTLTAKDADIEGKLTAAEGEITNLKANKLGVEAAYATYATIVNLEATNETVNNLSATHASFENATTSNFESVNGKITDLETKKLDTESASITYANIDFSNIGKAAIEEFFSKSGMISDLVVGYGTITGKLVGVTISGDLIEGNTVKAEKLVVKGSDGLYYKLNIDAGVTSSEEVTEEQLQNGLHGSTIIAKTITATQISVQDLVAFDATIGGFNITESSLYSGVKSAVDNTTSGIYLDSTGQMAIGDASNFIRYYQDEDGNYKLEISSDSITLGSREVGEYITEIQESADDAKSTAELADEKASYAQTLIQTLSDNISMLVTDGNGTSLMTQTDDGWVFSTSDIQSSVNATSESINELINELGDTNSTVDILRQAIDDLGVLSEYVKITTYEDEPCIELGEGDSDFKLLITNTRILFKEGSATPAHITNQSLHIKKAVIEEEMQQGGYVWKVRSNGNLGLTWKGGNT